MKKSKGSPHKIGWELEIDVDFIEGTPKNGWKTIDVEATAKQPVSLKLKLHSAERTILLECTTKDLKQREILRRKKVVKGTGKTETISGAKPPILDSGSSAKAKEGDGGELPENTSPTNIQ